MANKLDFANRIIDRTTEMMELASELSKLHEFYFDNGLDSGAADPITDQDVAASDITAAEIGDVINFAGHLDTWLNDGVPFQADWSVTLNKVRNVPS
jgi:hypothetical protein